jgi:hypothetical protein
LQPREIPRPRFQRRAEITQFFSDKGDRGSRGMRAVSEWRKFSDRFGRDLRQKGIPVTGTLHFIDDGVQHDGEPIAHRHLLDFVKDQVAIDELRVLVVDPARPLIETREVDTGHSPALGRHVSKVSLAPNSGNYSHWWASHLRTGEVPDPLPLLEDIVQKKARLSENYSHDIDELWLIVVADALQLETLCVLESVTEPPPMENPGYFNRVWLWDEFLEQVWQLFPEWALISDSATKTIRMRAYPPIVRQHCTARGKAEQ